MKKFRPLTVISAAITVLASACGGMSGDLSQYFAGLVDIGGGRKIQIECAGVGTPLVLLVSGKGNRADTWSTNVVDPRNPEATVFHQTAQFTRVCAYDRPGTFSFDNQPTPSDPVPHPVTAKDGVADLHALLTTHTQGPYVIVGHSYGGLIARLYASTYPDFVAGLVLDDALSEGLYEGLTAAQRENFEALNLLPEPMDHVRSFEQVISAPPVRPMPTVILTADKPPISANDIASGVFPRYVTVEFANALWSAQIAAQAALANIFPGARHITNTNSGHYIHLEQPQLVVDEIREVVGTIRAGKRGERKNFDQ